MEGNEDPVGVLRFLESTHGFEPRVEVTDIGFESVCRCGNSWIDEVCEGMAACLLEASQNVVVDGVHTEDVCFDESLQMLPTQEECCGRRAQQEAAVPVEDSLLHVARMLAESLELQAGLQVSEHVDVTALDGDTVGLQNLREPR